MQAIRTASSHKNVLNRMDKFLVRGDCASLVLQQQLMSLSASVSVICQCLTCINLNHLAWPLVYGAVLDVPKRSPAPDTRLAFGPHCA
jgi:hypothetical protein